MKTGEYLIAGVTDAYRRGGQMRDLISSHFATFKGCPPRQPSGSLRVKMQ